MDAAEANLAKVGRKAVDMSTIILDLDRKQSDPLTQKVCPRASSRPGDHGALGVRGDTRLVCGVKTCDHQEGADDRPWRELRALGDDLTAI